MSNRIEKIVILGGGTAGWMSAALLSKMLGKNIDIHLVESEKIGTIGVGEATIPPMINFNNSVEIDENRFVKETFATFKLGNKFENWTEQGTSYFHTFGIPGQGLPLQPFEHFWLKTAEGNPDRLWQYDLNFWACKTKKFGRLGPQVQNLSMPYAYHFDASLYAKLLRQESQKRGVKRTEGVVEGVKKSADSGIIEAVLLKDQTEVSGDLFIDCSGMLGLLIKRELKVGFESWGQWLPCDRAIAVPSESKGDFPPYTRSIAHSAGWQWQIPLQHRTGNGIVYSSAKYSDDEAQNILLNNLETNPLDDPRLIRFETGRTKKQWCKNVVAVGLSSGFLEPLEATSIYLIDSAIYRLVKLFPSNDESLEVLSNEYNKQSKVEYEQIRDFVILHYYLNKRKDSEFWKACREMDVPQSLKDKVNLFRLTAQLAADPFNIFEESSWLQVMVGQGEMPVSYNKVVDNYSEKQVRNILNQYEAKINQLVTNFPKHHQYFN